MFNYYENTKKDRRLERTTKEVKSSTKLFLVVWIVAACISAKQAQHTTPHKQPVKQSAITQPKKIDVVKVQHSRIAALKKFIARVEGYRSTPYRDVAGFLTVGYGHKVTGQEKGLTHNQLLNKDILRVHNTLAEVVRVPLTKGQYIAVASLTYNIGENAFKNSKLLECLNNYNTVCVKQQFNMWIYAAGKPNEGLKARRAREARLFDL